MSIVGGGPLVRYRELERILAMLAARNIHTQLVTSAVRPIPTGWSHLRRLQIVVSVDGLAAEHDQRRTPATYDRILKHIAGHQVTVHCTVTRQQVRRDGYLEEFLRFWQASVDTRMIWVNLYTPQRGEVSAERLTAADRERVIEDLRRLRPIAPKLEMFDGALEAYATRPRRPPNVPSREPPSASRQTWSIRRLSLLRVIRPRIRRAGQRPVVGLISRREESGRRWRRVSPGSVPYSICSG